VYTLVARDPRGRVAVQAPIAGHPLTIGRAPDCDLCLPSTAVSRKHASVYVQQDGVIVVTDEGSANGVKVDGHYISGPTRIGLGNTIQISDYLISVEEGAQSGHQPAPPPSQPAAAAQAPTAAYPQATRDPDTEEEELDTRLEAQTGAGSMLANTTLQLVGRGGPYDGTVFVVDKPLMSVGRTEADVVLEDPSISRRHAQLRLSALGDRFTVLDLRSSNGTFVDGQRAKRAECQSDSIVRFGDLAFKVTLQRRQAKSQKKRSARKTVLIAALAVLVLLVGGGIAAKLLRPPPPPPKTITPEERLRQLQAEVQTFVDEGRRRMTLKEWSSAIQAFDKAQAKDPLNTTARKLRQQALDELSNKAVYEKGLQFYGLGNRVNLVKAKEVFLRVPKTSVYHREVRYKLATINERLAEGFRIEGVSRCKARYWRRCHAALCRFFELLPEGKAVPGESRLREKLQRVERRLRRQRTFRPCAARRFITPSVTGQQVEDPRTLLAERYQLRELRGVLKLYVEGRIENALKALNKHRKKRSMRPHWATLNEVNRQLLIIRGKYQEGYSAYRDRDVVMASKHWDMVLDADKALIPPKLESFYRREVTAALGKLYFSLGDDEFKVMHYLKAFTHWSKGKQANPRHQPILNGLLQLEKVAERLIREGIALRASGKAEDGLAKIKIARDISVAERPIHKEALKALGQ
jgi:pSer/pThr/pTyr-binding forkhead associated (FHA) protein